MSKDQGDFEFDILDLETNLSLFNIENKLDFLAKLTFKKKEKFKLIYRNKAFNKFV